MSEIVKVDPQAIEDFVEDLRGFIQKYDEGFKDLHAYFNSMNWTDSRQEEFKEEMIKSARVLDGFNTYANQEIPRLTLLADTIRKRNKSQKQGVNLSSTERGKSDIGQQGVSAGEESIEQVRKRVKKLYEAYLRHPKRKDMTKDILLTFPAFYQEIGIPEQAALYAEMRELTGLWMVDQKVTDLLVLDTAGLVEKILAQHLS